MSSSEYTFDHFSNGTDTLDSCLAANSYCHKSQAVYRMIAGAFVKVNSVNSNVAHLYIDDSDFKALKSKDRRFFHKNNVKRLRVYKLNNNTLNYDLLLTDYLPKKKEKRKYTRLTLIILVLLVFVIYFLLGL